MENRELVRDLIKGGIAGAVATWVMGGVTTYMYKREGDAVHQREAQATGGETSLQVAARKLAALAGVELTERQQKKLGLAIHWVLGIGTGAAYGALRPRARWATEGQGLGFGTAFWLAVDEGLVPLLGLSRGPRAYPWQSHARGLAGHLTFGVVTETTLDLLDRVA
jgi:uncharacterized membrane protein YagU involved in acid resistance